MPSLVPRQLDIGEKAVVVASEPKYLPDLTETGSSRDCKSVRTATVAKGTR